LSALSKPKRYSTKYFYRLTLTSVSASYKPKTQEQIEKLACGERENWSRIACKDESLLACRRFREELEAEHGKV
jgi:hypothetical protein